MIGPALLEEMHRAVILDQRKAADMMTRIRRRYPDSIAGKLDLTLVFPRT